MNSLVTVKLDPARAKKLSQWARRERKTKSDVLRELIDERQKIETGEDLSAFVREQWGKGFGHAGRGSPSASPLGLIVSDRAGA